MCVSVFLRSKHSVSLLKAQSFKRSYLNKVTYGAHVHVNQDTRHFTRRCDSLMRTDGGGGRERECVQLTG